MALFWAGLFWLSLSPGMMAVVWHPVVWHPVDGHPVGPCFPECRKFDLGVAGAAEVAGAARGRLGRLRSLSRLRDAWMEAAGEWKSASKRD